MKRLATGLLICALCVACDETRVREGTSQFATLQPSAMRVLVTDQGIGELVQVANPEGLPLDAAAVEVNGADDVTIGPLSQVLGIAARNSTPSQGAVTLTTRQQDPRIFVPMRITDAGETTICRWLFEAAQIETTAVLALVETTGAGELAVVDAPTVSLSEPRISPVSPCNVPAERLPEDLDGQITAYVRSALANSAANSLPSTPLDILGLLRQNLQLTVVSPFDNRSGTLILEGAESSRSDAIAITQDGLSTIVDATADAQRARCAPPLPVTNNQGAGASPIDPAVADRFEADFALAISRDLIARIAQSATLAGYACRGLEDARPDVANEQSVPIDELLLEDLGLPELPTGSTAFVVMSPGDLPAVEFRAANGTVGVSWLEIQLEVYADLFGAPTRLAAVVADIELGLRPRSGGVGAARFDVESLSVRNPRVSSEFVAVEPSIEDVERWTQRTLLVRLEEALEFPLPLMPAAPVRVVGTQVRADDFVTYLRFE